MRALIVIMAVVASLVFFACANPHEPEAGADVCVRAEALFARCGVILPTLSGAPCAGAARLVARCVVDHATDCDALATLTQRLDACVEDELDGGELLDPPVDLPVPLSDDAPDAGRTDAGADRKKDGGPFAGADPRMNGEIQKVTT